MKELGIVAYKNNQKQKSCIQKSGEKSYCQKYETQNN